MPPAPPPRRPAGQPPANRGRRYPSEPLTPPEVRALIEAAGGGGPLAARNRALLVTLWRAGLRVSEALALRPRDLDETAGTVRVRQGKGGKARLVGLNGEAWPHLRAWLVVRAGLVGVDGRAPVFCTVGRGPTREAGRPLDAAYVRHLLPKLGRAAGIEKRVHAHGLRASHAADLIQRGATVADIRDQLGHASLATTDRYLREVAPMDRISRLAALA